MISADRINNLAELTLNALEGYPKTDETGRKGLTDPLDGKIIAGHYGESHYIAGLFICTAKNGTLDKSNPCFGLLENYLSYIHADSKLPDFHNDFNLFALCTVYDIVKKEFSEPAEKIKNTVLSIPDSNHDTVNWLPMRIFVNEHRYEWTKEEKYKALCDTLLELIRSGTWDDGFIEDRLPKGTSFNLQYDLATVSVLALLKNRYNININLEKQISALLDCVLPDGDINYLGRGCNQIFAWGPWIYLLSLCGLEKELDKALNYLENKLPACLDNNNLLLNDFPGEEKHLWWDYHYCSVYTAHIYFWLSFALADAGKLNLKLPEHKAGQSGVKMHRSEYFTVCTFNGRKEYLAEKGPQIPAIWSKKYGMIFKGGFGPWQGAFGKKYTSPMVLNSFCGLLELKHETRPNSRILRKLGIGQNPEAYVKLSPLFVPVKVAFDRETLSLEFSSPSSGECIFNFPVMQDCTLSADNITLTADGKTIPLRKTMAVFNQYGCCTVYQSGLSTAGVYKLIIK